MCKIAENAKIPTGLIYFYYKNKADLFYFVLAPVLYDWKRIFTTGDKEKNITYSDSIIYGLSQVETECLLNLFDHRQEFIIMMDKSQGTKYEHEQECMIQEIEKHLRVHKKDENTDRVFIHIIANNFVNGIMQIMYYYKGKEWAIIMLHKLSKMYLSGIGY